MGTQVLRFPKFESLDLFIRRRLAGFYHALIVVLPNTCSNKTVDVERCKYSYNKTFMK